MLDTVFDTASFERPMILFLASSACFSSFFITSPFTGLIQRQSVRERNVWSLFAPTPQTRSKVFNICFSSWSDACRLFPFGRRDAFQRKAPRVLISMAVMEIPPSTFCLSRGGARLSNNATNGRRVFLCIPNCRTTSAKGRCSHRTSLITRSFVMMSPSFLQLSLYDIEFFVIMGMRGKEVDL